MSPWCKQCLRRFSNPFLIIQVFLEFELLSSLLRLIIDLIKNQVVLCFVVLSDCWKKSINLICVKPE